MHGKWQCPTPRLAESHLAGCRCSGHCSGSDSPLVLGPQQAVHLQHRYCRLVNPRCWFRSVIARHSALLSRHLRCRFRNSVLRSNRCHSVRCRRHAVVRPLRPSARLLHPDPRPPRLRRNQLHWNLQHQVSRPHCSQGSPNQLVNYHVPLFPHQSSARPVPRLPPVLSDLSQRWYRIPQARSVPTGLVWNPGYANQKSGIRRHLVHPAYYPVRVLNRLLRPLRAGQETSRATGHSPSSLESDLELPGAVSAPPRNVI